MAPLRTLPVVDTNVAAFVQISSNLTAHPERTNVRGQAVAGDHRSTVKQSVQIPLPWQACNVAYPAIRTLEVPLRIALRQTVSASTQHDVPLL